MFDLKWIIEHIYLPEKFPKNVSGVWGQALGKFTVSRIKSLSQFLSCLGLAKRYRPVYFHEKFHEIKK